METKTKINQKEKGITLVALIITIIILVILAAVSIASVYNSKIVEYAINGTTDYAKKGINENKVLEGTESLIESAISNLKGIGEGIGSSTEPKPEEPNPPEEIGLPKEELAKDEMIGKYVDYVPSGIDYTVEGQYSGTNSNQTFSANNNMKWRIWGVEGDKLLLISETLAGNIQLQEENGYNNAVKILNDACNKAFGNSSYGNAIKVRSINQNDIDKVTNMTEDEQRKAVDSNYGTTYTPSNKNCPSIYKQELPKTEESILERSSQIEWYSGTTTFTSGKYTYYRYHITNYAIKPIYDALLTNMEANSSSGTDSHTPYWIASRNTLIDSSMAGFRLFLMYEGEIARYFYIQLAFWYS